VFASHRLKSLWNLHTSNMWMTATNLTNGIYTRGTYEYPDKGVLQTLSGPLQGWSNASNSPSGGTNYWTTDAGTNRRSWRLETTLKTTVTGAQPPIFTQSDFAKKVAVTYATPMPTIDSSGVSSKVTNETVSLEVQPVLMPGAVLQERTLVKTNVATIQTSFYWPKEPGGIMIYTAPLLRFVETRITGLTTDPIVLTNCYSQTYGPGHHNFTEEFIFEPRLDPGVPPATLAELNAANIQLIYVFWQGGPNAVFYVLGLDQKFRPLAAAGP